MLDYDYIKKKYVGKTKLCYIDTDIKNDVEKQFDISNYEVDWPHPISKSKWVVWLGKN